MFSRPLRHTRLFACLLTALAFHLSALSGCADPFAVQRTDRNLEPAAGSDLGQLVSDAPPRDWKFVIIHHTATSFGSVDSIDQVHRQELGWQGIGYHFLIGNGQGMEDGRIEATFRWREQLDGAHAGIRQYNELGIGICLVGNFEEEEPTPAQMQAVCNLVASLKAEFGLGEDQILRHRDLKPTACPGQNLPFEQIAAARTTGSRLAAKERGGRFTAVTPESQKGIEHVATIGRSWFLQRRPVSGGADER